jgi:hypothetical protein
MNVKIRRHGDVLGDVSVWAMVKLEDRTLGIAVPTATGQEFPRRVEIVVY